MNNQQRGTTSNTQEKSEKDIPEVADFLAAEAALQAHIASNPTFYKRLIELVEARNAKLEAAEKVVRSMEVSCGPFVIHNQMYDIDIEKLYDELGPDIFEMVGGYTETVTQHKLDRARFLSKFHAGQIPKEVSETCVTLKTRYRVPEKYKLPH